MANACGRPKTEAQHEWAERWLSSSRLSSYLDLCDGNIDCALELHEWNLMLGRVLMGDIAHFELALRNAYDRALTERFQGDEHWLFDANSPVTRPIMRNSKAKKNARREHGKSPRHQRRPWAGTRPCKPRSGDCRAHARLLGPHDRPKPRARPLDTVSARRMACRNRQGKAQPEARIHQQAAQPRRA